MNVAKADKQQQKVALLRGLVVRVFRELQRGATMIAWDVSLCLKLPIYYTFIVAFIIFLPQRVAKIKAFLKDTLRYEWHSFKLN